MTKRIRKHIKQILNFVIPIVPEKTDKKEAEFPLNRNNSDKLHWCVEINPKGSTVKISDITYLIYINNDWRWVVRYDDHGGNGLLHRHERLSLVDESEVVVPLPVRKNGNKKKLTEWVIDDIRKNYLNYRKRFLKRSEIFALY